MNSNTFTSRAMVPWLHPRSAYLHIPFCAHHCGYCDFAVTAGQDHLIELYLEALSLELEGLQEPQPVETIFLGGGTPTYLNPKQLTQLCKSINRWLPLSKNHPEFSIESTPDSITEEKLAILVDHGLTRISIGVQSFQGHLLPILDRIHGPEQVMPAIELARRFPLQISLDLIFGIPGQSLEDWQQDLDQAVELKIDHLSTYGLTYEKGTPLWKQQERGLIRSVTEELELEMYELAMNYLPAKSYEQYEISNFAQLGKRCRHNETYWANHAYFGFGVGAARYVQGFRELNFRNTQDYIRRVLAGESLTFQSETLSPIDRAWETIAIQLRRKEGIIRESFLEQTGFRLDDLIQDRLSLLVENDLLVDNDVSIFLSQKGKCVADGVITELMKSVSENRT
jgi:oxygen-independent coproporphyrinogen III oxidase